MKVLRTVGELRRALSDYPDELLVLAGWEGQLRLLALEGVDDCVYGSALVLDAEGYPERTAKAEGPQPFVGLWVSYMGTPSLGNTDGRETSQVIEVTETSVRLQSGVVLSRSALVQPHWGQVRAQR